MQQTDTLTTLFSHNLWANLLLVDHCAELSSEQLETSAVGTYGAIRAILEHIARGERSYFSRISTGQLYQHPADATPMTLAEIKDSLQTTGAGFIEWAGKVQAEDSVTIDWDGEPCDVPKTIILTQVINHATEHREQIKGIMTQMGVEPPDLQAWSYVAAML
jgi:uncharacterized damage-inducible protein DinB